MIHINDTRTCGACEFLTDIDKSQDGGFCVLTDEFHKFHNVCDERSDFMSDGVRETQCTRCIHRTMCKYKDAYLQAIQEVQQVNIHSAEGNGVRLTPITSLEFLVQPIELNCKYCQTFSDITSITYRSSTEVTK